MIRLDVDSKISPALLVICTGSQKVQKLAFETLWFRSESTYRTSKTNYESACTWILCFYAKWFYAVYDFMLSYKFYVTFGDHAALSNYCQNMTSAASVASGRIRYRAARWAIS